MQITDYATAWVSQPQSVYLLVLTKL